MSIVFTPLVNPPECPKCHLRKTSLVGERRNVWMCDSCGFHFTPCEGEESEIKLAIKLNERRKAFHVHYSNPEVYKQQRLDMLNEVNRIEQRISNLDFAFIMSDSVIEDCDKNDLDLRSQLNVLIQRKASDTREVTAKREGKNQETSAKPGTKLTADQQLIAEFQRLMAEKQEMA